MDLIGLIAYIVAAWRQPSLKRGKDPLRTSVNTLGISQAGEDPGFVGPEAYLIFGALFGALFKKEKTKLRIGN